MSRRRKLLAAVAAVLAVVAVAAGVLLYRSSHRPTTDCDIVHALIEDNNQFRDQMKRSAGQKDSAPASPDEYRAWAGRIKDYAGGISDPKLARDYAGIGIEFGNAISRMEYACLDAG